MTEGWLAAALAKRLDGFIHSVPVNLISTLAETAVVPHQFVTNAAIYKMKCFENT